MISNNFLHIISVTGVGRVNSFRSACILTLWTISNKILLFLSSYLWLATLRSYKDLALHLYMCIISNTGTTKLWSHFSHPYPLLLLWTPQFSPKSGSFVSFFRGSRRSHTEIIPGSALGSMPCQDWTQFGYM